MLVFVACRMKDLWCQQGFYSDSEEKPGGRGLGKEIPEKAMCEVVGMKVNVLWEIPGR